MKARKNPDYIFFGLLFNPKVPSTGWSTTWYQLKRSIYYFKRFFYDIWWFRGSDKGYTYNLLRTALEEQLKSISADGNFKERDEERIPKEYAIKRCIQILKNIDEDNYDERCGYDYNYDLDFEPSDRPGYNTLVSTATPEQEENNRKALESGAKLKEQEFEELMALLGDPMSGIRTWWR